VPPWTTEDRKEGSMRSRVSPRKYVHTSELGSSLSALDLTQGIRYGSRKISMHLIDMICSIPFHRAKSDALHPNSDV
jgi:hypothetical protein